MQNFDRVNVIGTSGAGKSTFAKKLAVKLNQPYISVDQVYWEKNWTEPPDERFFPKLEKAIQDDKWVLDGNYDRARHIKWKNVTTIIWLDNSFLRTLWQITWRSIRRGIKREELWPNTGNRESIWQSFFTKRSVIWWMITTHKKNRLRYEALEKNPPCQFIRLSTPREVDEFLNNVKPRLWRVPKSTSRPLVTEHRSEVQP